jgi:hypothetical protein
VRFDWQAGQGEMNEPIQLKRPPHRAKAGVIVLLIGVVFALVGAYLWYRSLVHGIDWFALSLAVLATFLALWWILQGGFRPQEEL